VTTEEALWKELGQRPTEPLKLALIDHLTEQGSADVLASMRWCVKWNRWPDRDRRVWVWDFVYLDRLRKSKTPSPTLPWFVFCRLPRHSRDWLGGMSVRSLKLYTAVERLGVALSELRVEVVT
jgi:hypothetical protein